MFRRFFRKFEWNIPHKCYSYVILGIRNYKFSNINDGCIGNLVYCCYHVNEMFVDQIIVLEKITKDTSMCVTQKLKLKMMRSCKRNFDGGFILTRQNNKKNSFFVYILTQLIKHKYKENDIAESMQQIHRIECSRLKLEQFCFWGNTRWR